MRMLLARTALAAAVCFAPGLAWAQTSEMPAPTTELGDVIVEARRLEDQARAFLDEVNAPPPGTRTARWNAELCISVSNMQPRFAQFVIDRIARTALDVGVDVGGPGCRPNVVIVATDDGAATADRLVRGAGFGFRPTISGSNLGQAALQQFRTSDAPVRWWHVTLPVMADTGQLANALRGDAPPTVVIRRGSRLVSDVRYDLALAIVVIDMSKTGEVPMGLLADYSAMVVLSQIDPSADTRQQATILNLFNEAGVDGFSDWDRDYMSALYSADTDRAKASQQRRSIVSALADERRERQAEQSQNPSTGDRP